MLTFLFNTNTLTEKTTYFILCFGYDLDPDSSGQIRTVGQKIPTKKTEIFYVLKWWMKASPVAWTSFMEALV
jgi:hypothetical protein